MLLDTKSERYYCVGTFGEKGVVEHEIGLCYWGSGYTTGIGRWEGLLLELLTRLTLFVIGVDGISI